MSAPDHDFDARMEALGSQLEEIERSCTPEAVAPARELLRAVLAVQQSGLRALLDALRAAAGPHAEAWLAAAYEDPRVSALLQMHELQPIADAPVSTPVSTPAPSRDERLIPPSRLIARIGGAQR